MSAAATTSKATATADNRITVRALLIGCLASAVFAWMTVIFENLHGRQLTATQVAVLPFLLLIVSVAILNPLLRRLPLRQLSLTELLIIYIMGAVSSGISTFGLASQLTSLISGLYNPYWNTEQSRWDLYIEPYVRDTFLVAVPGITEAARQYRDAHDKQQQSDDIYRAATGLQDARRELAAADARMTAVLAEEPGTKRNLRLATNRADLAAAERAAAKALAAWESISEGLDLETVLTTFPERVEGLRRDAEAKRDRLLTIKAEITPLIERFRRGLPEKTERAIPGIVYVPGEGWAAYRARWQRLRVGAPVRRQLLRESAALLALPPDGTVPADLAATLQAAQARLTPIAEPPNLTARLASLEARATEIGQSIANQKKALRRLEQRRRLASPSALRELNAEKTVGDRQLAHDEAERLTLQQRLNRLRPIIEHAARAAGVRTELALLVAEIADGSAGNATVAAALQVQARACHSFDASWRRFLVGDCDWHIWLRPLLNWTLLIGLTYLVLMAFNVLIFRQWAHNEKLVYPLAELPETLIGIDADQQRLPPVYRSGLFWAGFATSTILLGWNLLIKNQILTGFQQLLVFRSYGLKWDSWIVNSPFAGLQGAGVFHIFFTLIGLTFLVPAHISASLWGFHLLYLVQLLILVWLGVGRNISEFPANWDLVLNFRTAEGGGALMVFALVILWKCRKYLFCAFTGRGMEDLDDVGERRELRLASACFLGGSAALIAVLTWGLGINLFYSLLCYLVIIVITIGLVRVVAEGGLLGFQCHFGPLHLIRSIFGMDKSWTAPFLYAPLLIYYAVMFLDIKTFIAPSMANALKLRDDLKMSRVGFHLAVAAGILAAAVVAIATHIILGYHRGADTLNRWFYTNYPHWTFDTIRTMAMTNPVDHAHSLTWILFGAVVMAALLYMRRHIFWAPHPIGLIMLVNPIMVQYWFPIFLGWCCKAAVSKYGSKETYERMRYLFIGLIVGELLLCLFGADLNR